MRAEHWVFEGDDHAFVTHQGRRALRLKDTRAWANGVSMRDGVVEFDVNLPDAWSFHSLIFRALDGANYEEFYVRPAQSGRDDAMQYTPRYNDRTGWQLYFGDGFWANARFRPGKWMHVRVEIAGDRLRVFLDSTVPILVARLRRNALVGKIALQSAKERAYFANLRVEPARSVTNMVASPTTDRSKWAPGTIDNWEVSAAVDERSLGPELAAKTLVGQRWIQASPEDTGTVNLARYVGAADSGNTVFVRTTIQSSRDRSRKLTFGYSDRVVVYYNGRRIYAGNNGWRSRDFRYLGSIGLFDAVYLDTTERALNELVFAVSEDFGGWGIVAALSDGTATKRSGP